MMTRILTLLVLAAFALPMLLQSFGTDRSTFAMHENWEQQHLVPDHHHHHDLDVPANQPPQTLPFSMLSMIGDLLHLDSMDARQIPLALPDQEDGIKVLAVFLALACLHFLVRSDNARNPYRPDNPRRGRTLPVWLKTGRMRI